MRGIQGESEEQKREIKGVGETQWEQNHACGGAKLICAKHQDGARRVA